MLSFLFHNIEYKKKIYLCSLQLILFRDLDNEQLCIVFCKSAREHACRIVSRVTNLCLNWQLHILLLSSIICGTVNTFWQLHFPPFWRGAILDVIVWLFSRWFIFGSDEYFSSFNSFCVIFLFLCIIDNWYWPFLCDDGDVFGDRDGDVWADVALVFLNVFFNSYSVAMASNT